jgi:hypothetical protein
MRRVCLLLTLMMCIGYFTTISAQEYKLITKIDTAAKIAKLDNLGNLFLVTPANEVMKFNPQGKFLWNYSNNNFGAISQLDVTDPLRVILFYATHQQLIVLNNNLSEISRFSFTNNPDQQISLVASANNNGFWVYDQINRELKKLSNSFVDELKSGNIYQRNGFDMQANYMRTTDEYIFINDVGEGIRIFDRFGNFYKTAVINPEKEFDIAGNHIYFNIDSSLYSYNFLDFKLNKIASPDHHYGNRYLLHLNRLIIINEKGLTLWALKAN